MNAGKALKRATSRTALWETCVPVNTKMSARTKTTIETSFSDMFSFAFTFFWDPGVCVFLRVGARRKRQAYAAFGRKCTCTSRCGLRMSKSSNETTCRKRSVPSTSPHCPQHGSDTTSTGAETGARAANSRGNANGPQDDAQGRRLRFSEGKFLRRSTNTAKPPRGFSRVRVVR